MKVALVFGFSYNHNEQQTETICKPLPGIIIDLYLMYHYLIKSKYDKIIVITDIYTDVNEDETIPAVISGEVDVNIFTFIQDLLQQDKLYFFNDKKSLLKYLSTILSDVTHLFLYYTGHAIQDNLLFPVIINYCLYDEDDENAMVEQNIQSPKFPTRDFITFIIENIIGECQIILIFDCCHGSNFMLPFYLDDNGVYHQNNLEDPIYTRKEIVCIVSSLHDEKSHSTYNGSPFTQVIIKHLKQDIKTWLSLLHQAQGSLDKILGSQTIKLYANLPNIHSIWTWLNNEGKYHMWWRAELSSIDIKFKPEVKAAV